MREPSFGPSEAAATTERPGAAGGSLPLDRLDAVVFDLDGVLTDTARLHLETWRETFDRWLEARAERAGEELRPFTAEDYRRWLAGKPRYQGTASFLASRGISLPRGDPEDPPEAETVCGLGNRKDALFQERMRAGEVSRFETSVALVRELRARGVPTGVISSSRNCRPVLRAAGIEELFDVRVDGTDVARGLPGKPEPDLFLEAARRLGVSPGRTAVIEDSVSGVEAARRGGFAPVVGVDRTGHAEELRRAGADVVVRDLEELRPDGGG